MAEIIVSDSELSVASVRSARSTRSRRSSRAYSPSSSAASFIFGKKARSESPIIRIRERSYSPVRKPKKRAPGKKKKNPQEKIDEFWNRFTADDKARGRPIRIIPHSHHRLLGAIGRASPAAAAAAAAEKEAAAAGAHSTAATSYEEAAATCRAKVEKIISECRRLNQRYRDPHFDIEADLKLLVRDCLDSLDPHRDSLDAVRIVSNYVPRSVKRVSAIFDDPHFYIGGPTSDDVRQGSDGDCHLMAALCTLGNVEGLGLIERLCVRRDAEIGVYGFVFHRDGEWISEIIDDYLYLTKPDYEEFRKERILIEELERVNPEEAYRKIYQSNSNALYFASCENAQETWLPLLEKAYAKAHGDYASIEGGFAGEALEDLTGGVTTEKFTADVLDREQCWAEFLQVNRNFLFSCSTGMWPEGWMADRKGIMERHAYSVSRAVELDGKRLLKLKNPWGRGEWKGAWSDGSKEWNAERLRKLEHKFGDDGDFWIEYSDFLRKFQVFERTRLFGDDWGMTQIWTTMHVPPCVVDYQDTYFSMSVSQAGPVVIVLSQLDKRYFVGLEGRYRLELAFRVHRKGCEDYLIRSRAEAHYRMTRSVNVELDLEAGDYDVRIRIHARKLRDNANPEEVVKRYADTRPVKLTRVGLAYDLAHRKGRLVETEEEKLDKARYEERARERKRWELKEKILKERRTAHYLKGKKIRKNRRDEEGKSQRLGSEQRNGLKKSVEENGSDEKARIKKKDTVSKKRTNGEGAEEKEKEKGEKGENRDEDEDDNDNDSMTTVSEREMNLHIDALERELGETRISSSPSPPESDEEVYGGLREVFAEPWNAVGVVALRVYYKVPTQEEEKKGDEKVADEKVADEKVADEKVADEKKDKKKNVDSVVRLKVVRPSLYTFSDEEEEEHVDQNGLQDGDDGADEKKNKKKGHPTLDRETSTALDVDDSAMDATLEGRTIKEKEVSIVGLTGVGEGDGGE